MAARRAMKYAKLKTGSDDENENDDEVKQLKLIEKNIF